VGAVIPSYNAANSRVIVLFKKWNYFEGNWVTYLIDSSGKNGSIKTEHLDGTTNREVVFNDGKPVKMTTKSSKEQKVGIIKYSKKGKQTVSTNGEAVQLSETKDGNPYPPVTVVGYKDHTMYTFYNWYYASYSATWINAYSITPISFGGGPSVYQIYRTNVYNSSSIIVDVTDYLKCFTNAPGGDHRYTITICVDQPKSGQRDAWGFSSDGVDGNPINVGHTFLILTEVTPTGTTTRNIGFYPQDVVAPGISTSPGVVNNDQQHPYNISLTMTVTNSQFFNVLTYIRYTAGRTYDLNYNNCTTFCLNSLNYAGMGISATQGTWPGGTGYNPGSLGEDIRSMSLNSNMTRNMAPVYSRTSHPNTGNCTL
jgi:hypothetical protein